MSVRLRLLDSWRGLREADRLGTLLPRCGNRTYGDPADGYGFVTVDYRIYRDVLLAAGTDPNQIADLIEMYWSVRTRHGVQDSQWAAAVNAHVIQVVDGPLTVQDLDRLYRLVATLRRALQLGGIGDLTAAGKPVALHARGLLLGAELSEPVAIVDALATRAEVPLTIGRYGVDRAGELEFSGSSEYSHFYGIEPDPERLRTIGERFLHHDRLFRSQGVWNPNPPASVTDESDDDVL
jgi:hypothetical protein